MDNVLDVHYIVNNVMLIHNVQHVQMVIMLI